ncbi:hypothetical protein C8R43DRAFT_1121995 [Mycena crocata]|nr:hypothetical protein C8R43DRAFT_1121995 [Mycena crocata]
MTDSTQFTAHLAHRESGVRLTTSVIETQLNPTVGDARRRHGFFVAFSEFPLSNILLCINAMRRANFFEFPPPGLCLQGSTTSAARSAAPQSFIQVLDFRRARLHCTSRIQAWLRAADPQISIPFLEFIQYKDCALDHDPGGAQRRHANYSSTLSSMLYRSTPRDRAARSAASKCLLDIRASAERPGAFKIRKFSFFKGHLF